MRPLSGLAFIVGASFFGIWCNINNIVTEAHAKERKELNLPLPPVLSVSSFTDEEIFCATRTVIGEAGSESDYGKHLVAMTIVNRSLRKDGGATLCEVVAEPGQFHAKDATVTLSSLKQFQFFMSSYWITKTTLENYLDTPTWERDILYFHSGTLAGEKRAGSAFVIQEGGHKFYRRPIAFE